MKFINALRVLLCALLVAALALFVLGDQLTPPSYGPLVTAGGTGTKADPFLIETAEQFASFRDSVNSGFTFEGCYFRQTADLDLEAYSPWTPIGIVSTPDSFAGFYDGNGHVISNLHCDGFQEDVYSGSVALFGQMDGTIVNLGIVSGTIKGSHAASIVSRAFSAGAEPLILNCFSLADVEASEAAGGIAASMERGYLGSCLFRGNIDAPSIGGIACRAKGIYMCLSAVPPVGTEGGYVLDSDEQPSDYLDSPFILEDVNLTLSDTEAFFNLEPGTLVEWDPELLELYL